MPKVKPEFFLHCDVCGYDEYFTGKLSKEHIGHPCTECGADTLSEADFKLGARLQRVVLILQRLGIAKPHRQGDAVPTGMAPLRVQSHNGELLINDKRQSSFK